MKPSEKKKLRESMTEEEYQAYLEYVEEWCEEMKTYYNEPQRRYYPRREKETATLCCTSYLDDDEIPIKKKRRNLDYILGKSYTINGEEK